MSEAARPAFSEPIIGADRLQNAGGSGNSRAYAAGASPAGRSATNNGEGAAAQQRSRHNAAHGAEDQAENSPQHSELPAIGLYPLGATPPGDAGSPAIASAEADAIVGDIPIALLAEYPSGQVLYQREAGRRFMPASVTKVMTAYTAFKLMGDGKLRPSTVIEVDDQTYDQWHGEGTNMYLERGERVSVDKLLRGIMTISANDAAVALARGAAGSVPGWTELMNENARDIGMVDSHYGTPNGWPDGGATFVTARDLARLATAMIGDYPEYYQHYIGHREMISHGRKMYNHDPITGVVEGADGIKTGFTRQAGFTFLGSAERDGRRLIMVLAGASRSKERDQAARKLIEWGFDNFAGQRLFAKGAVVGGAVVQDSAVKSVPLRTSAAVQIAAVPGSPPPRAVLRYDGPLRAPIMEGDRVAVLEVSLGPREVVSVPLEAAQDAPKAGLLTRLKNGLEGWFG